jgi:hypothetical protein
MTCFYITERTSYQQLTFADTPIADQSPLARLEKRRLMRRVGRRTGERFLIAVGGHV